MERVSREPLEKYEGEDKDGEGYSGIEVQVYRDPKPRRKIVYAYIPGTDFSNKPGEDPTVSRHPADRRRYLERLYQNSHIMMRALEPYAKRSGRNLSR